jgi:hypothetical protein
MLEALAGFFALDVLLDRFEHDPVGRAAAPTGRVVNSAFQRVVDLERRCHSRPLIT